ncbi:cytochrome c oxidase subunit VB-domain-containing protein [Fimicolochytrium jonesii]|uniref:cytochrome c oxidase subunit VB-domain-containing protein n=1 Tax=Fimicolochytrium jonesii TaxID=1396493 RepID=UPI0022FE9ACB|nr:cytochrome c oxidase subunit VB-domain-containing protein [Fimicolochytrium jonesii]KAI8825627.1 cytochrome c oxidase subunit VB-domain-containing protein [Fimicolochytrium jonesii]
MSPLIRAVARSSRPLAVVTRTRAFSAAVVTRQATPTTQSTHEDSLVGFREEGQIPTNHELMTGNERYEYLARLAGKEPWEEMQPIYLTARGTTANPIVIKGADPERYIACTGFPADSHEAIWLTIRDHGKKKADRCPHCGNVFKYDQEHSHGHH